MNSAPTSSTLDKLEALREGIRNKYDHYHKTNKDRFPAIEYNTNRANYEPLRQSFEVEFYEVRGIDRRNNNLHIPSSNTLSFIFSNDDYWPSRKILNTCRSYAEEKTERFLNTYVSYDLPKVRRQLPAIRQLVLVAFALSSLMIGYCVYSWSGVSDELTISRPHTGQTVPHRLTIEGKASHADVVWVFVHPLSRSQKTKEYYLQSPIAVDKRGRWKGEIYIGGNNKEHIGVRLQVRAFAQLDKEYLIDIDRGKSVLHEWPKAKLATDAIEVIRGNEQ